MQRIAPVVQHGADLAVHVAHHKVVAGAQGSVLHQHRGDRSPSPVEFRFEHHATGGALGRRPEFLQVGHQADHFHQQIQIGFLFGGNVDEHRGATPGFRHQAAVGQLFLDPVGQRIRLVDLVDGDNDRHFGGMRMVNGFEGLRHHAIVGGHHQHDDVGGFRTPGTHAGKGLVTGGIEEYDLPAVGGGLLVLNRDLVGTNVLGDPAGLAAGNVGGTNGVEQRGFAMVDVPHDRNHGRTRHPLADYALLAGRSFRNFLGGLLFEGDHIGVGSEEARHLAGQLGIERLIDGGEHAPPQEPGN